MRYVNDGETGFVDRVFLKAQLVYCDLAVRIENGAERAPKLSYSCEDPSEQA